MIIIIMIIIILLLLMIIIIIAYICICVYVHTCIYVCMYVCMYIYIYIYTYIHTLCSYTYIVATQLDEAAQCDSSGTAAHRCAGLAAPRQFRNIGQISNIFVFRIWDAQLWNFAIWNIASPSLRWTRKISNLALPSECCASAAPAPSLRRRVLVTLLDLCASSLHGGRANILRIVPTLTMITEGNPKMMCTLPVSLTRTTPLCCRSAGRRSDSDYDDSIVQCGQSLYWDSWLQRARLKQNLNIKGWNSHVHRESPEKFESSDLSRETLSRETSNLQYNTSYQEKTFNMP